MFSDTGKSFSRLNMPVVVDHTLSTQLQRSTTLNILHWFYWSASLAYQVFSFCQKHLKQSFFYTFYSQLFHMMFIFSGTSRCCNSTFAIYIAANKEYLMNRQIIFICVDSAFPQLYSLKFSIK